MPAAALEDVLEGAARRGSPARQPGGRVDQRRLGGDRRRGPSAPRPSGRALASGRQAPDRPELPWHRQHGGRSAHERELRAPHAAGRELIPRVRAPSTVFRKPTPRAMPSGSATPRPGGPSDAQPRQRSFRESAGVRAARKEERTADSVLGSSAPPALSRVRRSLGTHRNRDGTWNRVGRDPKAYRLRHLARFHLNCSRPTRGRRRDQRREWMGNVRPGPRVGAACPARAPELVRRRPGLRGTGAQGRPNGPDRDGERPTEPGSIAPIEADDAGIP